MGVVSKVGICSGSLIGCMALLATLFHTGALRGAGVYPMIGRFADKHLNQNALGMSPAILGDAPWEYEYSMLPDLSGKVALVTGANSGIGYWTALHLARQGAHVVLTCRSPKKCDAAVATIKANYSSASLETSIFDLASLAEVRKAGEAFLESHSRLDILVCNAGLVLYEKPLTVDGIAAVFAINHVAHQLLYTILEPLIVQTAKTTSDARVVVVSSSAHFESYDDGVALTRQAMNARHLAFFDEKVAFDDKKSYMESKLANLLFAQEVAERMRDLPVYANSLHPGFVQTEIWDSSAQAANTSGVMTWFGPLLQVMDYFKESMWTPEYGALTEVYLAAAAEVREKNTRGRYFHPQALEVIPCRRHAANRTLQKALWAFTDALIEGKDEATSPTGKTPTAMQ